MKRHLMKHEADNFSKFIKFIQENANEFVVFYFIFYLAYIEAKHNLLDFKLYAIREQ